MPRLYRNIRATRVRIDLLGEGGGTDPADTHSTARADARADYLAVEEPLQIRVNDTNFMTTMRTPGADFELAAGLLFAEGVIERPSQVSTMRYCRGAPAPGAPNSYNVLDVAVEGAAHLPEHRGLTSSACGLCGTEDAWELARRGPFRVTPTSPTASGIARMPEALRGGQGLFRRTGGTHAAAACAADGSLVTRVFEDVGRHNAADKTIGSMLKDARLPATGLFLAVSSRASFELVQKAVLAGFSGLVAVSAATSSAAELARQHGLFLAGFVRGASFTVYSGGLTR